MTSPDLKLHEGQVAVLSDKRRFKVVVAGRRWGKALALDTPVPTPDGWTTMGALKDGDFVFDETGKPCRVVKAHAVMHGRPCYEVVFSDGTTIIADGEHLWSTWTHASRKNSRRNPSAGHGPGVRTTEEIAATLTHGKRGDRNHSIPCAGAVQYAAKKLPIDPYVLGMWLGDGDSRRAAIYTSSEDLLHFSQAVRAVLGTDPTVIPDPRTGVWCVPLTAGRGCDAEVQKNLRILNLIAKKHVPQLYLEGSVDQRLALLQGLMDTDGTCNKQAGNCEFVSIRRELAEGVLELALSLGIKATLIEGRSMLRGRDCGAKWRVKFSTDLPVFRLKRKLERMPISRRFRINHRFIVAVRPIASVPVRCITVDSPNRLYLCSRSFIVTHNTQLAKASIIRKASRRKRLIWYVAPTYRMARSIMWNELLDSFPRGWILKVNETLMTILLHNGTRIELKGADKPDCYDAETEILTQNGWVRFADLPRDVDVLTLNPETLKAEWHRPYKYIDEMYEGPMHRISSKRLDLLVTPDHQFLVQNRKGIRKLKRIEDISEHQDRIPARCDWDGVDDAAMTLDLCAIAGFYLAEGCAYGVSGGDRSDRGWPVFFSQTEGVKGGLKGDVRSDFKKVLESAGFKYRETKIGVNVQNKALYDLLAPLGNKYTKRIPRAWLNLPVEKLRMMLHWMLMGDGSVRQKDIRYYTVSRGLADDVQELAIKAGFSANIVKKPQASGEIDGRIVTPTVPLWEVRIYRNEFNYFRDSKESYISHEMYNGRIYCVGVQNHVIMVRRNGKICWSGNTLRGVGLHHLVIDEAQDIRHETWVKVLRPTLASTRGDALVIGTPKSYNWLYDLYMYGQRGDVYVDKNGQNVVNSWKSWQFPTITSPFIPKEEIEQARADMDEKSFRQEFLACHLPDTEIALWSGKKKKIKDITPDDTLCHLGDDGNIYPCSVLKVGITGLKQVCDVTIETGEVISASNHHKFKIHAHD